jgi:hypothetical protein
MIKLKIFAIIAIIAACLGVIILSALAMFVFFVAPRLTEDKAFHGDPKLIAAYHDYKTKKLIFPPDALTATSSKQTREAARQLRVMWDKNQREC